ncbi:PIG-L deacetylase family protein [Spirosoma radiotolerans]|uniref:GlcNAc-PI de-N-acetylase n=1 Tax=Spirosoma radiotolerans TaxID=1379870 RepID=A0A0E3ZX38_9BACT|nr:PIG-L deacetylase family protein [Spirosoma radiotolerans]AKD56113.1 GlcNAc-PI de-N-acetylase [Spirosoma radiotolerans]
MNSGVDKAHFLEAMSHPMDIDLIGNALVIAPHPDDESLGCGGTIALLRQQGFQVYVLFVSDGTMSHPNSPSYPAERLRQVRELEALNALCQLNVPADNAFFMRQKDTQVTTPDNAGFDRAVGFVHTLLTDLKPTTVLLPWRRDPHRDHRASWQVVNAALSLLSIRPRVLEYLIWLWELGNEHDMPGHDEMMVWHVPIESVMMQRNQAIAAHRSQVSRLIDDDPTAFYLSPELLMHFNKPRELFLEEPINEPDYA